MEKIKIIKKKKKNHEGPQILPPFWSNGCAYQSLTEDGRRQETLRSETRLLVLTGTTGGRVAVLGLAATGNRKRALAWVHSEL